MKASIIALWAFIGAEALECYLFKKCHKSDGGKPEFPENPKACGADEKGGSTTCLQTCVGNNTECYSYFRPDGFGSDCTEGGQDSNYQLSQGGCWSGPPDDKYEGSECKSKNADYEGEDKIKQACCTQDKCNKLAAEELSDVVIIVILVVGGICLIVGLFFCYRWHKKKQASNQTQAIEVKDKTSET